VFAPELEVVLERDLAGRVRVKTGMQTTCLSGSKTSRRVYSVTYNRKYLLHQQQNNCPPGSGVPITLVVHVSFSRYQSGKTRRML
jgi:hypothetical protein